MKIKKLSILVIGYWLLVIGLSGCATVPRGQVFSTYNIGGTAYVSLLNLCESEDITWEYDTFTRVVNLSKGAHNIDLMVGERLILVDGVGQYLKHPVDLYQGAVVVPYKFKEQVLDSLFGKTYAKQSVPLTRIRKVVIDAGHGGNDPGTIGKRGLKEKYVNLDIAKRLANLLKNDGLEVIMTRSSDTFVPLSRRVAIANNAKADLFISIHANANRVRSLSGFEVYCVTTAVNDSKRALDSARQGAPPDIDRSSFAQSPSLNLKATVWDMIYTSNRADALRLSRYVCRTIDKNLNTKVLGVKNGPFYVLKGAHMPAILIEVGYLSNYNEERLINNGYYRQQLAESIEQGIRNYIRNSAFTEVAKR
ncbi:MAG: N-acetylmuramoyl-L-alanine amidase [Candidatus Omnitrophica bacterium]|nr:N-acetylmuramoyl-L-alanine amidase [Candidatus Omnitrophota bacterium]MDD5592807.1 N-acetylmuramoyl-L-alanine amidase [Candidatus Omnitrophota bacterium]